MEAILGVALRIRAGGMCGWWVDRIVRDGKCGKGGEGSVIVMQPGMPISIPKASAVLKS